MKRPPGISRTLLLACAIGLAASGASAQSAKTSLDGAQAEMFNRISDRLVCRCGCNMILRVCNHFECPSAIPMRAKIEEELRAGKAEEDIVRGFVEEHGVAVLSSPPAEGINLAAWVMPGFAALIGAFLLFYFTADWVAKRKVKPVGAERAPELDADVASRIEQELRESG